MSKLKSEVRREDVKIGGLYCVRTSESTTDGDELREGYTSVTSSGVDSDKSDESDDDVTCEGSHDDVARDNESCNESSPMSQDGSHGLNGAGRALGNQAESSKVKGPSSKAGNKPKLMWEDSEGLGTASTWTVRGLLHGYGDAVAGSKPGKEIEEDPGTG